MNYAISKNKKNHLLNKELSNNYLELTLNKKTIILNNQELIDEICLKEIMPKINKLAKKILIYIDDEDDDQEQTSLLYDDLAKLRSLILKKYENHLSDEIIQIYMKNIRFLAGLLRKRLNTYQYEKLSNRTR